MVLLDYIIECIIEMENDTNHHRFGRVLKSPTETTNYFRLLLFAPLCGGLHANFILLEWKFFYFNLYFLGVIFLKLIQECALRLRAFFSS